METATLLCDCGQLNIKAHIYSRAEVLEMVALLDSDGDRFIECSGCGFFIDADRYVMKATGEDGADRFISLDRTDALRWQQAAAIKNHITWTLVRDQTTDDLVWVAPASCGLGCRCAAQWRNTDYDRVGGNIPTATKKEG